jgi:probable blue pigment (indigoidine) exporter
MSGRLTTLLTAATAPAAWGTTYVVTTQLLPPGRPLLAATLRALVAGLVILAATRAVPPRAWLWRITVLGALNFGFFFPLLFFSAYRLPGGVAATVGAAQPLIVALEGWVLLGRRPAIARVGAGLTAACGVALLVVEPSAKLDVVGVLAALAGTLSMATGIVMTERWGRPAPLLGFTGWQLVVGGAMVVPIALAVEGVPAALTLRNGVGYVYLAVVGAAVAYPLWLRGIERLGGSATSFLAILSPLTAAVAGLFVLGQGLTFRQWIGFGIALGSVLAAQLAPGRASDRARVRPARPPGRRGVISSGCRSAPDRAAA